MDTAGVPMPTMNWEATNLPKAWHKFQQHTELMFSGPLKKKEVSYFGHLLTADGVKPDPAKVAAVRDMEPPKDKGELETVLGKDIPVADTLSRKSLSDRDTSLSEGMDIQVHTVYSSLPVSDSKLEEIRTQTEKDQQFQILKGVIQRGWPDEKRKCPLSVSEFWNHRDELSYLHGIIFKGEKIVVPTSLRSDMLSRVHASHLGIEKSKQKARDIMFWSGMGKEIENMISKCSICLTYFELDKLHSTTSAAVISKLKASFARHGIPKAVISDSGPQYSSGEFETFARTWEFTHTTASLYHSQSNGLAEKSVHTAKMLLEKTKADKSDPYLSLLEYRNSPVDRFKSPAQLLMSHRLRSTLPNTNQQLLPKVVSCKDVRAKRTRTRYGRQIKPRVILDL
ncbi:hypothetical protein M9458_050484 [Cirrhinus mrigala]|uniref:Gypsy retrotransposon integrase-like protein 1 n=1 Tax=Cirrhinus mrigala TaxID=683832 RepID=A0ABD0MYZ1_CIRMR